MKRSQSARRNARGFSLIDVLITVAIVGILAAIAVPSYQSSVRKGNRGAAESYLSDIAQRQQQYLLDQRSYAPDEATLSLTTPASVAQFYTVTIGISAGPPPAFTASATPKGSQAADLSGQPLTITNTGAKGPSGAW
jgi:type IV pilus assembly protein PilE